MSISTQGGNERQPSTVKADRTTSGGKPGGAKPAAKPAGGRPGGAKGGRPAGKGPKGRKPIAPVKVGAGRNWGPIAVVAGVLALVFGIIGTAVWYNATSTAGDPWEERAAAIKGIDNIREKDANLVKGSQHQGGPIKYTILPPVAGPHNPVWQNCMGDVYDAPIANEHAVHSLEHGAVWVTYKQGLPQDQVDQLVKKVRGQEKLFMSPVAGMTSNISLQAWGYQLKVDTADDKRIDEFIKALNDNASIEGPTAVCSGGVTATGTTPRDVKPSGGQ